MVNARPIVEQDFHIRSGLMKGGGEEEETPELNET